MKEQLKTSVAFSARADRVHLHSGAIARMAKKQEWRYIMHMSIHNTYTLVNKLIQREAQWERLRRKSGCIFLCNNLRSVGFCKHNLGQQAQYGKVDLHSEIILR